MEVVPGKAIAVSETWKSPEGDVEIGRKQLQETTAVLWRQLSNARTGTHRKCADLPYDWPLQIPAWAVRDVLIMLTNQGFQVPEPWLVSVLGPLQGRNGPI